MHETTLFPIADLAGKDAVVTATSVPASRAKPLALTEPAPNDAEDPRPAKPPVTKLVADVSLIGTTGRMKGSANIHYIDSVEGNRVVGACGVRLRVSLWTTRERPGLVKCAECASVVRERQQHG